MSETFTVYTPPGCEPERRYIIEYILGERLGLDIRQHTRDGDDSEITARGRRLFIPDLLFKAASPPWDERAPMPADRIRCLRSPFGNDDVVPAYEGSVPCDMAASIDGESIRLNFDLFGDAFFHLSRLEELVVSDRDVHGRFPASSAWLVRAGCHDRPLVDEAVDFLDHCCGVLWPGAVRRRQVYTPGLSHDIDHAFLYHGLAAAPLMTRAIRKLAGDVIQRRSPAAVADTIAGLAAFASHGADRDPYFTLPHLMAASERRGLRSTFFFISNPALPIDGRSYVDEPLIRSTLREIAERGHEIGLHASYGTLHNPERAHDDVIALRRLLDAAGVPQAELGVRHHYLRWSARGHWRMWDSEGLAYDASVGYAEHPGYRCATSHEFPTFDLETRRALTLRERPLLAMDVALCPETATETVALRERVLGVIRRFVTECRRRQGRFELLWHNTQLNTRFRRLLYEDAAALCAGETGP